MEDSFHRKARWECGYLMYGIQCKYPSYHWMWHPLPPFPCMKYFRHTSNVSEPWNWIYPKTPSPHSYPLLQFHSITWNPYLYISPRGFLIRDQCLHTQRTLLFLDSVLLRSYNHRRNFQKAYLSVDHFPTLVDPDHPSNSPRGATCFYHNSSLFSGVAPNLSRSHFLMISFTSYPKNSLLTPSVYYPGNTHWRLLPDYSFLGLFAFRCWKNLL